MGVIWYQKLSGAHKKKLAKHHILQQIRNQDLKQTEQWKKIAIKNIELIRAKSKHKEQIQKYVRDRQAQTEAKFYATPVDFLYFYYDLDMFYLSCESIRNRALLKQPSAVGKGVICSANYIARSYGVCSAMPCFVARLLCPSIFIVETQMEKYKVYSDSVLEILGTYTQHITKIGIDEGYFKVSVDKLFGGEQANNLAKITDADNYKKVIQRIEKFIYEIK